MGVKTNRNVRTQTHTQDNDSYLDSFLLNPGLELGLNYAHMDTLLNTKLL